MIKAIILDVDGVIVGNKTGINFPLPHKEVIKELKNIHAKGMPIILCTTKFNLAILNIIKQAYLNNPHITDNGALIIDPINAKIIKKYALAKSIVIKITRSFIQDNIYFELYSPEHFYIQKTQVSDFTLKRANILQIELDPIVVQSLFSIAEQEEIIKINCFAKDEYDVTKIEKTINQFKNGVSFFWSFHEDLYPIRPCIITALNVSKVNAVMEIVKSLKLSFNDILGVGDSISDWNFMKLCKYVATLENGDEEIKKLVRTKSEGNYLIAPHINNNGIFEILKYFLAIKRFV